MLIFYPFHRIVGYHWRAVGAGGRLHIPQPGDTVCVALCGAAWRQDLAARDLEALGDSGVIAPVAAPVHAASRR